MPECVAPVEPPILIVDDDPVVCSLMRDALENQGFDVVEAGDGEEACGLFETYSPQLVVTDVVMPRMDGFALCRELRRRPESAFVPILMATGLDDVSSITEAYEAGATDFIAKPLNLLILGHRVRYMLRASRALDDIRKREQELATQSKRMAEYAHELERSNHALEQFAFAASHDLQEPLRMVASYCQLLQRRYKGRLDDKADEFIGFAVEGATRMQQLISDLLTYSQIGSAETRLVSFPAASAVEAAMTNLKSAIAGSGARFEVGPLPVVAADPHLLVGVFESLFSNAIKFRRDVPVIVRISASPEATDGGRPAVRFTIEDNGIGIAPEYHDQVFRMFQRLHQRGKYEGTGSGLALAKRTVEYYGGRIWIESTPGTGVRVNFTLPLVNQSEDLVRGNMSGCANVLAELTPAGGFGSRE